jgi:hypothetical protein
MHTVLLLLLVQDNQNLLSENSFIEFCTSQFPFMKVEVFMVEFWSFGIYTEIGEKMVN